MFLKYKQGKHIKDHLATQDETRLPHPSKRNTKVCSRTVRATFTAYGSPEISIKNPSLFSCVSAMFPMMDHRTNPLVTFYVYGNFYTTAFVSDLEGPFVLETLYIGSPVF
jgi:hypothetical protein